jgi:hypothetical protein
MIPNQFQTYEKGNTIAKSGKGNAKKKMDYLFLIQKLYQLMI